MQLIIGQTAKELDFIYKKVKDKNDKICLPLNLETLIFCEKKKINYFKFNRKFENKSHYKIITESEKLVNKLKYGELKSNTSKLIHSSLIRFKFYSIAFIIESINLLEREHKLSCIIVSGWNSYKSQFSKENYFLSSIIDELYKKNFKIIKLKKDKKKIIIKNKFQFFNFDVNLDKKKEYYFITNLHYNFYKIIFILISLRKKIIILKKGKNNSLLIFLCKLFGVKFINVKEDFIKLKKIKIPKISFYYNKKNISKLLNYFAQQENLNHSNLENQQKKFKKYFSNYNIKVFIGNFLKGIEGVAFDYSIKRNIKSIIIPHGTVSKHFNKYDKIYKKIIAQSLFNKEISFVFAQSKISLRYQKKNQLNNFYKTGNIIFAHNNNILNNKKFILYAVTMKDFRNMHFVGVESFFEYYENLKVFNNLAKKFNFKFLIKLHPSVSDSIIDLRNLFKNLFFSSDKIDTLLKKSYASINYSSTVIEDSICSKVPVILYDPQKRYKHCEVKNSDKDVVYLTNENSLVKHLLSLKNNTLKRNKNYLINNNNPYQNIFSSIKKIINEI